MGAIVQSSLDVSMRICSLLPSATEIVYALGLGDQLVGVTHECDYPPEATRLPAVTRAVFDHSSSSSQAIHNHVTDAIHGGTSIYALDRDLLAELRPDLILTQELCEVCAVSYDEVARAVRLLPGEQRVLSLEPTSLDGVLQTIDELGRLAGAEANAGEVIASLRKRIERVGLATGGVVDPPRVLCVEWLDPLFVGGHWVPEMVQIAGGYDGLTQPGRHSRQVSWQEIASYDPTVIVFMPCGYDLRRTVEEFGGWMLPEVWTSLAAVRAGRVYATDGSAYFSRPGPRLVDGLEILAEVLHPEMFPRRTPQDAWQMLETTRA
jgi:iron complex transport system substrate-binding protein